LIDSFLGPFSVDLALIRGGPAYVPGQAVELADYLTPGGALVVTAPDKAGYQAVCNAVLGKYPQFTALHYSDGTNGIILAAKLAG
jgi:hypothetical protein